jgi:hypothetical protein
LKLIYTFSCLLLLSSCKLFYTTYDADYDRGPNTTCSDGTYGENRECEAQKEKLKKSMKKHVEK